MVSLTVASGSAALDVPSHGNIGNRVIAGMVKSPAVGSEESMIHPSGPHKGGVGTLGEAQNQETGEVLPRGLRNRI